MKDTETARSYFAHRPLADGLKVTSRHLLNCPQYPAASCVGVRKQTGAPFCGCPCMRDPLILGPILGDPDFLETPILEKMVLELLLGPLEIAIDGYPSILHQLLLVFGTSLLGSLAIGQGSLSGSCFFFLLGYAAASSTGSEHLELIQGYSALKGPSWTTCVPKGPSWN